MTLGDNHRKQWNSYRLKFLENWNCEPMCLLPADNYAEDKSLSKAKIKGMAEADEDDEDMG